MQTMDAVVDTNERQEPDDSEPFEAPNETGGVYSESKTRTTSVPVPTLVVSERDSDVLITSVFDATKEHFDATKEHSREKVLCISFKSSTDPPLTFCVDVSDIRAVFNVHAGCSPPEYEASAEVYNEQVVSFLKGHTHFDYVFPTWESLEWSERKVFGESERPEEIPSRVSALYDALGIQEPKLRTVDKINIITAWIRQVESGMREMGIHLDDTLFNVVEREETDVMGVPSGSKSPLRFIERLQALIDVSKHKVQSIENMYKLRSDGQTLGKRLRVLETVDNLKAAGSFGKRLKAVIEMQSEPKAIALHVYKLPQVSF